MTDSAQRPSTLQIALRRFLELRTDAPGFVKDFTIAVLQAEHVLDAESPTSAPATGATPTNALIQLPVEIDHHNEALGDTGDYIGHTALVDARGQRIAEWVDLGDEDEDRVKEMAERLNRSAPVSHIGETDDHATRLNNLLEAARVAEIKLRDGGTYPINGETWRGLRDALLPYKGLNSASPSSIAPYCWLNENTHAVHFDKVVADTIAEDFDAKMIPLYREPVSATAPKYPDTMPEVHDAPEGEG